MSKNLPPIFKVNNSKLPKNTNQSYVYASNKESNDQSLEEPVNQTLTVEDSLDQIFHTRGYSFNVPVEISFAGKKIDTYLAARTKNNIITLDNETIPISTITSLKIKKPIK